MYYYNANDNNAAVTTGANNPIVYAGVIQANDGYGGYNTRFTVTGTLAEYHIHFAAGGTRVKVIRYKSSAGVEGTNIISHGDGDTKTLSNLIYECQGFANHVALLTNLKDSLNGAERLPNGQLA